MNAAIKVIQQLYTELNRGDIDAMLSLLDKNVLRIEPEGFPSAGTYRGSEAIRSHFTSGRGTWAEGACTPTDFMVNGDKTVVTVHIKVLLKNNYWIDTHITDGFTVIDGRITEYHSFGAHDQALAWACISTENASLND